MTVLLLGGVVGLLLFNTSMQQSAFAATSLEQRATVLSARQEALASELEQLRDPQQIARRAQRMGMQVPAAPLFLDLADGSVSGDAAGATLGARLPLDPLPPARPSELDPPATVVTPPEGVLGDQRGDGSGGGDGGKNKQDEKKRDKADKADKNKNDKHDKKTDKNKNEQERLTRRATRPTDDQHPREEPSCPPRARCRATRPRLAAATRTSGCGSGSS